MEAVTSRSDGPRVAFRDCSPQIKSSRLIPGAVRSEDPDLTMAKGQGKASVNVALSSFEVFLIS